MEINTTTFGKWAIRGLVVPVPKYILISALKKRKAKFLAKH